MGGENANFEFNMASGVYEGRLEPAARDKYHLMQKANATEAQTHQANYDRERGQRIADREKSLTEEYHVRYNMPRPPNVPPPKPMTAQEIQEQAKNEVDQGHVKQRDEMTVRHKNAAEDYMRGALGLPTREHVRELYKSREAAYLARVRREKQERSHSRNHTHDRSRDD